MDNCFHCGDPCTEQTIIHDDKKFCCNGCKLVYEILSDNDLGNYYDIENNPGTSPSFSKDKFNFLENEEIVQKLLEFNEQEVQVVQLSIPSIHCSSCIWVLENLQRIHHGVKSSQVDFPKKTVRVTFNSNELDLKALAILLASIGYEPYISLDDYEEKDKKVDRSLIYKLGVAGFAFGNVMFLSFPEYFEVQEFWLDQFKGLFRWMMFAFSLPVVFYAGIDYLKSAYKGVTSGVLNIDIPIALGIIVLFVRSTIEIVFDLGTGFLDSLTGLVFFLLLGRFFQQRTYAYLSFDRDFKSYFPIAVTRLLKKHGQVEEDQVPIYKIEKGDRLLIRSGEILPVDAVLLSDKASMDYSFVTGESDHITKYLGEVLYAGGRQQSGLIEVEAIKNVEQSYLTSLWSNDVFKKKRHSSFQTLVDRISKKFTVTIISVAVIGALIWLFINPLTAINVFTAVLIVACPCAIALSTPFTMGNMLRIYGNMGLYLKESVIIERMSQIDTIVFDKTGTITTSSASQIEYKGEPLNEKEEKNLASTLRGSNHPLSRALYNELKKNDILPALDDFKEVAGKGLISRIDKEVIKVGSPSFTSSQATQEEHIETAVHVNYNQHYKGKYTFKNKYRTGVDELFERLSKDYKLHVVSGDNAGEKEHLKDLLPSGVVLKFNQQPEEKLNYIKELQSQGARVMMVGDGLNDAGALTQSDVGVSIAENVNVFTPACDGIMDASILGRMDEVITLSRKAVNIINWCFILSLFYNIIGISIALSGNLTPVMAAILMPVSSLSVVAFTTIMTNYMGRKFSNKTSQN
ncbi:heavy metal translocating P-type ATPase [Nonlabens ulvanivorans]|uniref:ATPase n=1 Tax=Nonlabens ulvanivorans TaxID=906888 RepID=A0A084JXB0_NONUL|nr:heavy metal translocating P-type ATPase metal-binding domain-containing protein [Nonlabens ulvanivorans]KEZ93594.1 ATPase [Nonlabens ulvanivorans]PRX14179.1 Cu+-exporting ATPase [Nonlabens ulvanivorans]